MLGDSCYLHSLTVEFPLRLSHSESSPKRDVRSRYRQMKPDRIQVRSSCPSDSAIGGSKQLNWFTIASITAMSQQECPQIRAALETIQATLHQLHSGEKRHVFQIL